MPTLTIISKIHLKIIYNPKWPCYLSSLISQLQVVIKPNKNLKLKLHETMYGKTITGSLQLLDYEHSGRAIVFT